MLHSRTQHIIKQLVTLQLLLLFTMGIAPKQYLHDVFAGHTDSSHFCNTASKAHGCVHTEGYHCQLDHPVINTEYSAAGYNVSLAAIPLFDATYSMLHICFPSALDGLNDNRGPPYQA